MNLLPEESQEKFDKEMKNRIEEVMMKIYRASDPASAITDPSAKPTLPIPSYLTKVKSVVIPFHHNYHTIMLR